MMTQGEIESLTIAMEKAASRLEMDIMKDIVRRIKANEGMTSTAEYQIDRLRQMGLADDYIKKEIQAYLKVSDDEMDRIFRDVPENEYGKYSSMYQDMGIDQKPFGNHVTIQSMIDSSLRQTAGTFQNISQTLGFAVQNGGKTEFLPVAEYYQKALDNAILGVATGAFDYNSALSRVVKEMTRSGLRTVDYASGRSYRIESASRMALMTGFSQITGYMNEQVAAELGTDDYEVSYHLGARPTHQWWQGRVYSYQELLFVCGLGTVTGLCGINCYHWYEPFIRGVSVRNYTDQELDAMIREENRPRTYQGKEYTAYTALQKQRKMELQMRAQRQETVLLKEGGGSPIDILAAQARYRTTMNEYVSFSKAMNMPQQMERVYMDGLGRVAPGRNAVNWAAKRSGTDSLFEKSKLSKILGVGNNKIDFGKIDERSKKSVYNGIKKVFDSFPQLKGHTRRIIYDPNLTAIASSDSIGGVLKLSKRFCDFEQLAKDYERQTKLEWNPKGTTADSIIVHELGHQLDGFLTLKGIWGGQIGRYGTIRTSAAVQREVLQRLGYYDYIRTERANWRKMGYEGRELNEAVEFSGKEFITNHVSEYAFKNEREFFAECFSEYMTSKKPREAAKIFGEVLEEIMEGL